MRTHMYLYAYIYSTPALSSSQVFSLSLVLFFLVYTAPFALCLLSLHALYLFSSLAFISSLRFSVHAHLPLPFSAATLDFSFSVFFSFTHALQFSSRLPYIASCLCDSFFHTLCTLHCTARGFIYLCSACLCHLHTCMHCTA